MRGHGDCLTVHGSGSAVICQGSRGGCFPDKHAAVEMPLLVCVQCKSFYMDSLHKVSTLVHDGGFHAGGLLRRPRGRASASRVPGVLEPALPASLFSINPYPRLTTS